MKVKDGKNANLIMKVKDNDSSDLGLKIIQGK